MFIMLMVPPTPNTNSIQVVMSDSSPKRSVFSMENQVVKKRVFRVGGNSLPEFMDLMLFGKDHFLGTQKSRFCFCEVR